MPNPPVLARSIHDRDMPAVEHARMAFFVKPIGPVEVPREPHVKTVASCEGDRRLIRKGINNG